MTIEFQIERTIDAPPERVFEALTDLNNADAWMPNLLGIDILTDGEIGEGTTWREKRKMFGMEAEEEMKFAKFEPPTRVDVYCDGADGTSGSGEYYFTYSIREEGGGSKVVLDAEITGMGTIMSFIGRFFSGPFKKAFEKDLDAMKDYLEQ